MRFHIQVPATMSEESCSGLVDLYSENISLAELVILDFSLVENIESSGLLRIYKMCSKINPNCNFKVVNAKPKIKELLKFTPLKDY
jgi:anti-anti-sigma regulatory factor